MLTAFCPQLRHLSFLTLFCMGAFIILALVVPELILGECEDIGLVEADILVCQVERLLCLFVPSKLSLILGNVVTHSLLLSPYNFRCSLTYITILRGANVRSKIKCQQVIVTLVFVRRRIFIIRVLRLPDFRGDNASDAVDCNMDAILHSVGIFQRI